MNYRVRVTKVSGDTVSCTLEIARPAPVPTRTKFRMRRLLRLVRAAAFNAARGQINKPLSVEAHSSLTQHVIQVFRDTAQRYAHLRT